jgi:hypothetical protein
MKLADSVWHRVVQIIQESMLTGVDCADLLRQVRLQVNSTDPTELVLTDEYQRTVAENYKQMVAAALRRNSEAQLLSVDQKEDDDGDAN